MVDDKAPLATYAPLRAQRRRRREQALARRDQAIATLYDEHDGRMAGHRPDSVRLAADAAPAPPSWARLFGLAPRLQRRGAPRTRPTPPRVVARGPTSSGARVEAALAQRITGPGSGPYSGTPFRPPPGAADAAEEVARRRALGAPCEAARHDHGIIDHSRHVSSLGRR